MSSRWIFLPSAPTRRASKASPRGVSWWGLLYGGNTVGAVFGADAAQSVRVLYGGSAKPENIMLFMPEPDIDGALVGGAALVADSFYRMVKTAADFA